LFSGFPATDTEKSLWLDPGEVAHRSNLTLALPTYLPDNVDTQILRDDIVPASRGATGWEARIFLLPNMDTDAPNIAIYESKPKTEQETGQCDPKDCQTSDISGTSVTCRVVIPSPGVVVAQPPPPTATPPEMNPRLRCEWQTDQMWFQVEFGWVLAGGAPTGVSPDMRAEMMQTVTSMVDKPFTIAPNS
ncbi:MAG: hypothetical protein ABSG55_03175, partial [Dehalococcoidia bacterium]